MTAFTDAATFGLVEGALIVAVVESKNVIDYSIQSDENSSGAAVQVVPAAPTSAPQRGEATTES